MSCVGSVRCGVFSCSVAHKGGHFKVLHIRLGASI